MLCSALFTGCKSANKTSLSPTSRASFTVLETLAAGQSVRATDIYPPDAPDRRFAILDDGEITFHIAPTNEHGASLALAEGDERTAFISTDSQGNIVMHAVFEADDNAISLFDPPLVIAFNEMIRGREYVSESRMRVVDATNLRTQKESGKARRTITYVDDQRIAIPAGEFLTKRLTITFDADLKLANAHESTTIWVAADSEGGIVARQSEEQIKVLGLGGGKHSRTIVALD